MKVLFLPVNIASMQPITCKEMNNISGVDARCIIDQNTLMVSSNENVLIIPRSSRKNILFSILNTFIYFFKIKKWIKWADVLHYVYTPGDKFNRDLAYAHKLGKKIFVEFVGSDIRIPELLSEINPYYKHAYYNEEYEYKHVEKNNNNLKLQKVFSNFKATPIVNPEMQLFLNQGLFPKFHQVYFRINVHDFIPLYPKVNNQKPIIIHSPSALIAKGSNIILQIVDRLKFSHDFEFILIHKKPRKEVLELLKNADIFIDQIILGTYAMAAMEAMSYGKPTLCYIMPQVYQNGLPKECPVVNVNPDTLEEKLIELIENPKLRHNIGLKSREFVEKYHNAGQLAFELQKIYSQ